VHALHILALVHRNRRLDIASTAISMGEHVRPVDDAAVAPASDNWRRFFSRVVMRVTAARERRRYVDA
jgi:hypothetical protein